MRIPSRISGEALSCPDSFGGAAFPRRSITTEADTDSRDLNAELFIVQYCTIEKRPVAPRRGGRDLRKERQREILISPYPNCIISHASPSREWLEIAKNYGGRGVGIVARKATGIANISSFSADPTATGYFLERITEIYAIAKM